MSKIVIFDLDGTLLDTSPGVFEALRLTFEECGYDIPDDSVLRRYIGPPLPSSFIRETGCSKEEADKMTLIFQKYYIDRIDHAVIYDGMIELIRTLRERGVKTGVATYKPEKQAIPLLKDLGVGEHMDVIHGNDELESIDKKGIIELCISDLNGTKEETVMIGDSIYDSDAATAVGVDFIGVTYGFGFSSKEDLSDIPHIGVCATPKEVLDIL